MFTSVASTAAAGAYAAGVLVTPRRIAEKVAWSEVEVVASGRVGWVATSYLVQETPR